MPKQVDEAPSIEPKKSQMPEGYIRIEPSSKGRWHTAEMLRREAYRVYGKLLSAKLKKQLDNDNNPWVSKQMLTPRDIKGTVYTGPNAIMLALWTEQQGFELPFFITEEELRANELGILQDAKSLFILHKNGTSRVYNIAQTTFPVTQRRSYESLKLNMIATERKKTSGYQFLDADGFCKTALKFDGVPGLSIYDYAEKVIHIAPKSNFETEDDYYRDLAVAMVESTREVDFDTLRLDTYLFENLVSHLGSGIISQSCRFNATNPEYSRIWRERLENNPEYTKRILEQSDAASGQVLQSALT
ncbi:ArdC-like ssDNA-binding domain-containing protein [Hoylesella enoeca]|nr:ArdC-like ssDNA-binding domain-containing protein [Hoylesella enoeca]